jgi:hypothetical protein
MIVRDIAEILADALPQDAKTASRTKRWGLILHASNCRYRGSDDFARAELSSGMIEGATLNGFLA